MTTIKCYVCEKEFPFPTEQGGHRMHPTAFYVKTDSDVYNGKDGIWLCKVSCLLINMAKERM